MPSSWRARSPEGDAPPLLLAGYTIRALAQAARDAGYAPLGVDVFGDDDTIEACADFRRIDAISDGCDGDDIVARLDELARDRRPVGIVLGAGFENAPALVKTIAARWTLFGATPECWRSVRQPDILGALCARAGLKFPEIRFQPPDEPRWLIKQIGGSGGTHIQTAAPGAPLAADCYAQRRVPGEPLSALLLAERDRAHVIGWSRQWTAPSASMPFRYCGAQRIDAPKDTKLGSSLTHLVMQAGLRGLVSVDMLDDDGDVHVIEVNPRPGATLDLFDARELLRLHLAACRGEPIEFAPEPMKGRAAQVVFASSTCVVPDAFDWPDWAVDRTPPKTVLRTGDPICTIVARCALPGDARRLLEDLTAIIRARIETHQASGAYAR